MFQVGRPAEAALEMARDASHVISSFIVNARGSGWANGIAICSVSKAVDSIPGTSPLTAAIEPNQL
jgi:hypothetical protein